jgi:demethylmenaquinone methyltransferase/2-methoxy-6-polyprenyl-1,4-benzoquinol methylase
MSSENNTIGGPSRRHVRHMFDEIAGAYDLANRVLSLRRDIAWRRRLTALLPSGPEPPRLLDLATGTCDVLIAAQRAGCAAPGSVGADFSAGMLREGAKKLDRAGLGGALHLVCADATGLGFAEARFDAVTIAFGIRNVLDVDAALREMCRVLRPGGRAIILEFSMPGNAVLRAGYLLYFRHVLPRLGGLVSGKPEAYRYLNQSVESFPHGRAFCERMEQAGFVGVTARPLTFGIATLYTGLRPGA